jgi:hypothetical protein
MRNATTRVFIAIRWSRIIRSLNLSTLM